MIEPVARLAERIVRLPGTYSAEALRASLATYLGNPTKAKQELGWSARSLEDGLAETLRGSVPAPGRRRSTDASIGWAVADLGLNEPSPTQSKLSQVVEPDVVWARPVGDEEHRVGRPCGADRRAGQVAEAPGRARARCRPGTAVDG